MKLWLVSAVFLFLSLPVALGLKCYVCSNSKSWDECKSASRVHICPAGFDRCSKVFFKAGDAESFSKYCIPKAGCNADENPTCKGTTGPFECIINCCDSDKCNAGSVFRVSGTLLLTCALMSLMMLAKA